MDTVQLAQPEDPQSPCPPAIWCSYLISPASRRRRRRTPC